MIRTVLTNSPAPLPGAFRGGNTLYPALTGWAVAPLPTSVGKKPRTNTDGFFGPGGPMAATAWPPVGPGHTRGQVC